MPHLHRDCARPLPRRHRDCARPSQRSFRSLQDDDDDDELTPTDRKTQEQEAMTTEEWIAVSGPPAATSAPWHGSAHLRPDAISLPSFLARNQPFVVSLAHQRSAACRRLGYCLLRSCIVPALLQRQGNDPTYKTVVLVVLQHVAKRCVLQNCGSNAICRRECVASAGRGRDT